MKNTATLPAPDENQSPAAGPTWGDGIERLPQKDSADLCGKHVDTIRRARVSGQLPNSVCHNGMWYIAKGDLINVGLLDASMAAVPADEIVGRSRAERAVHDLQIELGAAMATIDAVREENKFLRGLVINQAVK